MEKENAIEVHNITKRFKVYMDKGSSMKEKVLFRSRNKHEERWVLKGISFSVKKGEAIGLIGKNGCGKSTTLKMLTRIMYPTSGNIEIKGRVSSLIELGAGFHPDMSGRENIFTNASIFGLTHDEIERRLDDIIRFSELEEFIDNPVRTYSSGMYMRLAFAVAINVDADILLIDEILAVGDVSFQEKCFEKLKEIKRKGTTIVIVSHVTEQIKTICDRALWIEEGLLKEDGEPNEVTEHYLASMEEKRNDRLEKEFQEVLRKKEEQKLQESAEAQSDVPAFCISGATRKGDLSIRFTDGRITNAKGEPELFFEPTEKVIIDLDYEADKADMNIDFTVNIARDDGLYCYGSSSLSGMEGIKLLSQKNGKLQIVFEHLGLMTGRYLIDVAIQRPDGFVYDYLSNALEIRVKPQKRGQGITYMGDQWIVDGKQLGEQ